MADFCSRETDSAYTSLPLYPKTSIENLSLIKVEATSLSTRDSQNIFVPATASIELSTRIGMGEVGAN